VYISICPYLFKYASLHIGTASGSVAGEKGVSGDKSRDRRRDGGRKEGDRKEGDRGGIFIYIHIYIYIFTPLL
jgi:hypothetical protein